MRPETAKHLEDVRLACLLVENFTGGKTFAEYAANALLQSAVERQFITIGEALAQAEKLDSTLNQVLTGFRQIVGFRNILVHGYAMIQHATVWGVIENDLPILKKEVDTLLQNISP